MNDNVKCVEKQSINSECMHVKCKTIVTIMWNNSTGIKFHVYHLATILWGNLFSIFSFNIGKAFYKFCCIL
jgi:hypothetical protein